MQRSDVFQPEQSQELYPVKYFEWLLESSPVLKIEHDVPTDQLMTNPFISQPLAVLYIHDVKLHDHCLIVWSFRSAEKCA